VRGLAGSLLAVALLSGEARARAQEPPACRDALAQVTDALERDERRTRVWWWSWLGIGAALSGGQAALAAVTTGNLRLDFEIGTVMAAFIPASLLVHPPGVLTNAPRLAERLALTAMPDGPGDPCEALPRARELLARTAADEVLTAGWPAHALVLTSNVTVGLLLGLLAHDWFGATKQIVGGIGVGEALLLTFPRVSLAPSGLGVAGTF